MHQVLRRAFIGTLSIGAALTLIGAGGPPNRSQVTGGGQIIASADLQGAGDTIAFTAQDEDGARGQVQYVDREGGTGQGQTVRHGTVTCLVVEGNTATIGGHWEDRDGPGEFEIRVVDNGQGDENDLVTVTRPTNLNCDQDPDEDDGDTALARGNARVHDAQ